MYTVKLSFHAFQAAIDQNKSEIAGQEVAFAKAIATEQASIEGDPKTGLTRDDIERELEAAALRKKRIDDERAAKAGAEVAHVSFLKPSFLLRRI